MSFDNSKQSRFSIYKQTNDIRLLKNILIANYKYENQNSILLSNYLELEDYTISYTVDDMGDYFLIETRLKMIDINSISRFILNWIKKKML